MRTVIIGAGAAGISAAVEITKRKPWEEILILAKEEFPYSRCMLHQYISGERKKEKLAFVETDFLKKQGIGFQGKTEVRKIDTKCKCVVTEKEKVFFDKLLVATGSQYVLPPIPNFRNAKNLYGLRNLEDAEKIKEGVRSVKSVVIVGSGLVGMDIAYALCSYPLDITVVERASRIMPLQTDDVCAKRYQNLFEQAGVHFRLGVGISDTSMNGEEQIQELVMSDGSRLCCDMVIVAAGVRPNVDCLNESELFVNRGIQVDEYMQTSCRDIYAAGDVTGMSGIWPNAVEQGRIAAVNMTGGREAYNEWFCTKNTSNFFGMPMLSVGSVGADGDNYIIFTEETAKSYKKIIVRNNWIVGALFQGDIQGTGIWQYLIKNRIDISRVNKPLFNISIADFTCFDEDVRKRRVQGVMGLS